MWGQTATGDWQYIGNQWIDNTLMTQEVCEEKIKEKNSSDLFFPNLLLIPEITGMNAEFIAPSPKSLLKRLGSLKEIKNASDTKPAPIIFAINRSLA